MAVWACPSSSSAVTQAGLAAQRLGVQLQERHIQNRDDVQTVLQDLNDNEEDDNEEDGDEEGNGSDGTLAILAVAQAAPLSPLYGSAETSAEKSIKVRPARCDR